MVCWGNTMDEAKKGLEVRSWSRTMIFCEEAFTVGVLMPLVYHILVQYRSPRIPNVVISPILGCK
jgi:hypothetical protein